MNKELMNGMRVIVRDNMWYDCETEEMGITPDGLQEIISLCADEAIKAVDEYAKSFDSGIHLNGTSKAIEKRMK